jgi:hypothetical protein
MPFHALPTILRWLELKETVLEMVRNSSGMTKSIGKIK